MRSRVRDEKRAARSASYGHYREAKGNNRLLYMGWVGSGGGGECWHGTVLTEYMWRISNANRVKCGFTCDTHLTANPAAIRRETRKTREKLIAARTW